jgi:hypothetical protein
MKCDVREVKIESDIEEDILLVRWHGMAVLMIILTSWGK